jgi:two-component system, NtrC family, sensor kinase
MKIMIAEDDPVSLALINKTISKVGKHEIIKAPGARVWELFEEQRPRIVVSDWMMPEISGIELCKRIRAFPNEMYTYIIIMTVKDRKKDILAGFAAGADDYMVKPFDVRELQARINTGVRLLNLEDRHKGLQGKLVSSRNKIRTVFDALTEEIISVDRDINLMSINEAAMKVMDGSYEDIIGAPCCTLSDKSQACFYEGTIKKMVHSGFASGNIQTIIDRFTNQEGREKIMERTAIPVKDDTGQVHTITFVSRNVTQDHRQNEEVNNLNLKLRKISSELIKKNVELEKTLRNLEQTQAQMLQSEKMASIGQLAAGVAHEINNPTGFVSSNLKTLSDYQNDMSRVIDDYRALKTTLKTIPGLDLPDAVADLLARVEASETEVDIDYIREDVGELIGDCREGTERIKKIVEDLKHFAHPGEDRLKETDINAGIESTLNVVNNELKYKATIVKELGNVPIVYGYPQQLNQVFMNILVNAAQAIEKSGEIRIVTGTVGNFVEVRISDTGCGIAKENINKIFDPFFTTKEVGKGTGLGMNIAYNIINKHGGDIHVESTLGQGTTFIIHLPVGTLSQESDDEPIEQTMLE